MINILHLCHKYGKSDLFSEQIDHLDRDRFRSVIVFLTGEEDSNSTYAKSGHKVIFLNRKKKHIRWYNVSLIKEVAKLIDAEQIDIVSCQQHRSTPIGVISTLFAKAFKPKVLTAIHGLGSAKTLKRRIFNFFLFRRIYKIVAVSKAVENDIVSRNFGLIRDKVITIHNGLNYDAFLKDQDVTEVRSLLLPEFADKFCFGTVGRLSEVKNPINLVLAFQRVTQKSDNCILAFVGTGPQEAEVKAKVAELGIEDRVVFFGYRKDVPVILKAFDVFMLPSLREGLPLAMLEAMASGMPVIASRVGGIPEMFDCADDFGRLVDPLNPESIAAAMLEVLQKNPDRLAHMGVVARKRAVEDFSAIKMKQGYLRLFEETVASSK